MWRKFFATLDQAPMFWVAVGLGFLIFSTNRILPGINWDAVNSEQSVLDQGFVQALRNQQWQYQAVPGIPQTFGAHVLPQYLRTLVSQSTGDSGRAGIWLSLLGISATLCGLYPLCLRIFPMRGFGVVTVAAAGALGALQFALSPDPSAALGMALVVWGMVLFLTAITKHHPHDVFASGLLFGLAGYIRIELSLMWIFLALYLICLSLFQPAIHKNGQSYFPMALGGLFTVLLVLWPMLNRNIQLSGSPILPGFDAEMVLDAPRLVGQAAPTAFITRVGQGLKLLMLSHRGPGVFAGLLWPLGVVICLLIGRHKKIPYFWLPVIISMLICLSALSYVTGFQSYRESLLILTPLLFPFAVLPAAFVIHHWMQSAYRPERDCQRVWLLCGLGLWMMIQLPHFFRMGTSGNTIHAQKRITLIQEFSTLPAGQVQANLLSDMPGSFLTAGKANVIGVHGETDWQILTAKYANGAFQIQKLRDYMQDRQITLIHLSDVEDPLADLLAQSENAPGLVQLNSFSPPHRVFRVDWP
jgi:hypothetical protein